ncbi:MAG: Ig domain-containing protein [Bacteroidales bacterium]|nr:Ig domain-containing protein [Bacteroidales bacterium]
MIHCKIFSRILFLTLFILSGAIVSCSNEEDDAKVEEIIFTNIHNGKLKLNEGEDFKLEYIIKPTELQDVADIAWETTDKSVARVRNGKITAEGEGTATISAYAGNAKASVTVTVYPQSVTSFSIPSYINAYIDNRVKVEVTNIEPEYGSISTIEWKIADESIATFEIEDGELYVTALKNGTTTLTGIAENCKKSCNIVVKEFIPAKSITVTLGKTTIETKKTTTVSATVSPNNASIKDVKWSFSPASYVEFDESTNTIKGIKAGTVTVTATSINDESVSGSATLTITPAQLNLDLQKDASDKVSTYYNIICPDKSVGKFNSTIEFTLTDLNDPEADLSNAVWKSSNENIATVSNGVVTAKGHGYADISATINNTTVKARVRSVKSSSFDFSVSKSSYSNVAVSSLESPSPRIVGFYYDETFKNDDEIYLDTFWEFVGQSFSALSSDASKISITNTGERSVLMLIGDAPGSATITITPKYGKTKTISAKMALGSLSFIKYGSDTPFATVTNGGSLTVKYDSNTYVYRNVGTTYDPETSELLTDTSVGYNISWSSDNSSRQHPFYGDRLFYSGTYNNLTTGNFGTFKCNLIIEL